MVKLAFPFVDFHLGLGICEDPYLGMLPLLWHGGQTCAGTQYVCYATQEGCVQEAFQYDKQKLRIYSFAGVGGITVM